MRLVSFRVRMFRNLLDSGEIAVEEGATCLVGKNESGKTALLQALHRLNPAHGELFDVQEHYPRWRLTDDRREGRIDDTEPIRATFTLESEELEAVERSFGPGVLQSGATVALWRRYGAPETLTFSLTTDEVAAVRNVLDAVEISASLRDSFGSPASLAELVKAIEVLRERGDDEAGGDAETAAEEMERDLAAVEELIQERLGDERLLLAGWSHLRRFLPTFFYFSDYSLLPGRVDLEKVAAADDGTPASGSLRTARALLELAGTKMEALRDENYELRTTELEAVSNDLTSQVFNYWRQNRDLEVSMDVDKETQRRAQGQFAVARFLEVRVRDRRHGYTNSFAQRSSGFRWFFSFLAAFSEFRGYDRPVIVLLDEPALTLHGRAQADFLRFIDERLAPAGQVIYTTHSPFMVEMGRLERVRIVEDKGPNEGAKVSTDVLASDPDSVFPLQAALGYDIAQSLFVGGDNLVVEGTSDFAYLTVLSDHLKAADRSHLDERWRIVPVGGAQNIPTFVALLGSHLDVTVLIDSSAQGMQRLREMTTRGQVDAQRLITIGEITSASKADVEDLFELDDYLKLYNGAFKTSLRRSKLKQGERVLDRISRTEAEFDHGKPADYLLRHREDLLPSLSEATLARFGQLFERINATLAANPY